MLQLRGEIIARTEGIPAIRAAQKEAYQQLVDSGRITEAEIERAWHNAGDRRVRDTHDAMGGQTVRGLNDAITNFDNDPQRLLFGGENVKQYDGRTRR